ncbi:MAG: helix-turn-helix domain-containing protein [Candidatus ainarchaeum sp.]|nr:helix-turn-helix domain-containing protein [Candidatus ainarchaeum sp.]
MKKLKEKELISNDFLVSTPYLKNLVLLLRKNPNLVGLLRDSNLAILLQMLSLKTVKEISKITNCDEQTVYKLIQNARRVGLVLKIKNKFVINETNWPKVKEFLQDLLKQEMSFDKRVPKDSIIYFKSENEILFSTNESINASKAAFLAFSEFGVKVLPLTNYYYLPKKRLSAKEIFDQALLITKIDFDCRNLVFLALFILKNKVKSDDEIVKNICMVFEGNNLPNYPSKKDLQEKAKLYGLRLS